MVNTLDFESNFTYSITHWIQPIYELNDGSIMGYEALLRDTDSSIISPMDIFAEADKNASRNALDFLSIKKVLDNFSDISSPLFINVFPSTLMTDSFLPWLETHKPSQTSVVLELLEAEPITYWEKIKKIREKLQEKKVKFAIDDLGAGYSSLRQWIELNPDYMKFDKYYSQDLTINIRKQKILQSMVNILSDSTKIIIEGIESKKDLAIVKHIGIPYAQGYYLGKPYPREHYLYK